jgi:hypothetical protein
LRISEDLDRARVGSNKVEARADGGAPLLDHRDRPSPDALTDDIAILEEWCRAARSQSEVIRGRQRSSSEVIRGHRRSSSEVTCVGRSRPSRRKGR